MTLAGHHDRCETRDPGRTREGHPDTTINEAASRLKGGHQWERKQIRQWCP